MWHLGTCFHGVLSSAGLMVELEDIQGLSQPKLFHVFNVLVMKWSGICNFKSAFDLKKVCGHADTKVD